MLELLIFTIGLNFLIGRLFGYALGKRGYCFTLLLSVVTGAGCIGYDLVWFYVNGVLPVYEVSFGTWIKVGYLEVSWAFLFDNLSIVMIMLVWTVSSLVHAYSVEYMKFEPAVIKFLSYLSLFTFFMLILVSAANFVVLFLGWEGVGLASYLLISFWSTRIPAGKAAIKALVMNRFGDFALLLAICLMIKYFKTTDFVTIFALLPYFAKSKVLVVGTNFLVVDVIAFLLVVAAVGKSAQIGLHTWLPDAMEGPTPVSALIHAATMVTAGVYLLIRCSYFLVYSPTVSAWVVVIGTLTTIAAGFMAFAQMDIKRIIAYSTCSQLGYMFTACGVGNFSASLFHLVNHAFFKALLFLVAGAIIHTARGEQDIRKLGGLIHWNKFYYACLLIASLSLMGLVPLSGYYSKELIISQLYTVATTKGGACYLFGYWGSLVGVFLTALYSTRLLYYCGFAGLTVDSNVYKYMEFSTPWVYCVIFTLLGLLSIFSGFLLQNLFLKSLFFSTSFPINSDVFILSASTPTSVKAIPIIITIITFLFVLKIYDDNDVNVLGYETKGGVYLGPFFNTLFIMSNKRLFIDNLYNFVALGVPKFAYFLYRVVDKGVLEACGPSGIFNTLEYLSYVVDNHHSRHVNDMAVAMIYGFLVSFALCGFGLAHGLIWA